MNNDLQFVQDMIDILTNTLSVTSDYYQLRDKLRGFNEESENGDSKEKLFLILYKTWSYNPISTLTLCLMSRNYELAYNLIPRFTLIEMDVSKLI